MEKGTLPRGEDEVIPVGDFKGVNDVEGHKGLLEFVVLLGFWVQKKHRASSFARSTTLRASEDS